MFKANIRDTRRRSGVFLVNFEHVLHFILISILLTLNRSMFARNPCFNTIYTRVERQNGFTVLIVDFEHISHLVLVFLLLLWACIQWLSLIFHISVTFKLIWILVSASCPMVSLNSPAHYALGNLLYKYFNLIIYVKITYCHFC